MPLVHDLPVPLPGQEIVDRNRRERRNLPVDLGSEAGEEGGRAIAEGFLLVLGFVLVPGGELLEAVIHVASCRWKEGKKWRQPLVEMERDLVLRRRWGPTVVAGFILGEGSDETRDRFRESVLYKAKDKRSINRRERKIRQRVEDKRLTMS
jgi:hypothetical protein